MVKARHSEGKNPCDFSKGFSAPLSLSRWSWWNVLVYLSDDLCPFILCHFGFLASDWFLPRAVAWEKQIGVCSFFLLLLVLKPFVSFEWWLYGSTLIWTLCCGWKFAPTGADGYQGQSSSLISHHWSHNRDPLHLLCLYIFLDLGIFAPPEEDQLLLCVYKKHHGCFLWMYKQHVMQQNWSGQQGKGSSYTFRFNGIL